MSSLFMYCVGGFYSVYMHTIFQEMHSLWPGEHVQNQLLYPDIKGQIDQHIYILMGSLPPQQCWVT